MKEQAVDKVHFPGLNPLRFFAALSVYIGHVELTKRFAGLPNNFELFDRINFGGIGVYFFFVLSGFLITYLLCVEKNRFGTISVKDFYLRRVLRIWPVYYLIVIVGFYILPSIDFFKLFYDTFQINFNLNLLFYLLILPNVAYSFMPSVPHIGQAWSIGVEEQFYIFWPLIVKRSKNVARVIMCIIIAYVGLKFLIALVPFFFKTGNAYIAVKRFFGMSKFECMLVGAYGAVVLFNKGQWLIAVLQNKYLFIVSLLFAPSLSFLVGTSNLLQDAVHLPLSFFFLVIIMHLSTSPSPLFRLENRVLDYLGKISYGFYMYHLIILFLFVKLFAFWYGSNTVLFNLFVFIVPFTVSILLSHFSYQFFEKYFIGLKKRFTHVVSG